MPNKNVNVNRAEEEEKAAEAKAFIREYLEFINTSTEDLKKKYPNDKDLRAKIQSLLEGAEYITEMLPFSREASRINGSASLVKADNLQVVSGQNSKSTEEIVKNMKKAHLVELEKSYLVDANTEIHNNNAFTTCFVGENNIFKKMSDILKDGDAFGRGSSSEYKEIQRDLKELDRLMKGYGLVTAIPAELSQYAHIMLISIAERANKYVKDRNQREMQVSTDSYQGKRIQCMKQINSRMKVFVDRIKSYGILNVDEMGKNISANYKRMIHRKIAETTFTRSLFCTAKALNDPNVITYGDLRDAERTIFDNPTTNVMASALLGTKISEEKQLKCWDDANGPMTNNKANLDKIIADGNQTAIAERLKLSEKFENKIQRETKYLEEHDMLYDDLEKYTFKYTGIRNVDIAMFNHMKKATVEASVKIAKITKNAELNANLLQKNDNPENEPFSIN